MMRVLLVIACLLLASCSLLPKKEVFVEVPVPVTCVTWEPEKYVSKFDVLEHNSPVWEQVKALLIDRESAKIYEEGLQSVIEGCK